MSTRSVRLGAICLAAAFAAVTAGGCSKEESAETTTPKAEPAKAVPGAAVADAAKPAPSAAEVKAQIEAKLAKADLLDGKADKVVSRCASCALSMDGSTEHVLETSGYSMHFCTAGCSERFAKDLTKSVLAMKIPED